MHKRLSNFQRAVALTTWTAVTAALVVACGGGADNSDDNSTSSLTLTGVAATGLAMSNASIVARCVSGEQAGTADESGAYTMQVAGGALPCVLQATNAETTLYSLASGSGDNAVANITPITHIVLAKAMGDETTVAAAFAAPTADQLNAAAARLPDALAAVRVALASVASYSEDPFTTAFTASHGEVLGDAFDQELDTLRVKLGEVQSSLRQLTHAIATSQGDTDSVAAPAVVGVLTPPASVDCPHVRSGRFVAFDAAGSVYPGTLDLAAQTWTYSYNDNDHAVPVKLFDNCIVGMTSTPWFTVAFNDKGLGVFNGYGWGLVLPIQPNTMADLAGNWNAVTYVRENANQKAVFGLAKLQVNSDGSTKTGLCTTTAGLVSCQALEDDEVPMTVANGLFSDAQGHGYLFKAINGSKFYVHSYGYEHGIVLAAQPWTMALPAVDEVLNIWDISNRTTEFPVKTQSSLSVTKVNSATNKFTLSDGQVRVINKPLEGMSYRAATTSSGAVLYLHAKDLLTVYGRELQDDSSFIGFSISR